MQGPRQRHPVPGKLRRWFRLCRPPSTPASAITAFVATATALALAVLALAAATKPLTSTALAF